MAQIDHSIYLQQQGPDFGKAFEGFERGMRLGDMMKQNKIRELEVQKQSAIDEAFKAGQVQNPDGSVSFDKSITLKQLMGVDPREAQKAEMQFQQQDIMKQKNHANILFQESIKSLQNPAYYPTAVDTLIQNGVIKPGEAPPTFDESFVKMAAARAGDAKDYLDNLRKEQESQARLAETKMNNDFRREELGLRRIERKDAIDDKIEEKQVALSTPYGLANTVDDAKQIKSADEEKKNFDSKIVELINLRKKYEGGNLPGINRKDQTRAEQLSKDLLLSYKNMAKLGVLSQSDEAIINAIIPEDPLQMRGLAEVIQGEDAVLNKLTKFKSDSDKDFANKVNNRVRGGGNYQPQEEKPQPSTQDIQAFEWAQKNQNDPRAIKIIENLKARGF